MQRSKMVAPLIVVLKLTLGSLALASPEVSGAYSPEVLRVVIDPRDSNVLYVIKRLSSKAGAHGVFKSIDAGQSWFAVNEGLPALDVRTLAIDPQNPDTLYVGLGTDFLKGIVGDIFKSINGGGFWSSTAAPPAVYDFHEIEIDPRSSNTIFAGGNGVQSYIRSTDGGVKWTSSGGLGHVLSFAIDPLDSQTIYAGVFFGFAGGRVFKSDDGGDTWSLANRGLPNSPVQVVLIDHQNPNILYAGTAQYGLYKSTDGAAQWEPTLTGLLLDIHCLAIDPRDSSTLYAGVSSQSLPGYPKLIFKTTDGGDTWVEADAGIGTRARTFSLAIDPQDSNTIYAGTTDGIFRSIDGGENWFAIGR